MQPEKGAAGISCKGKLQVLRLACAQGGFSKRRGAPEELDNGHGERMQQVAVEEPCRLGFRVAFGVVGAEAGGEVVISNSSRDL